MEDHEVQISRAEISKIMPMDQIQPPSCLHFIRIKAHLFPYVLSMANSPEARRLSN